eukprot:TRINITY_DN32993_c2_g1_i1.p1 TRINITY_DN32993_c2_g1~~TRINITY_DN32993_c2_g1_i1.p1  ORF type:complete len:125 (-),score=12.18 TRINITY_DN32993_c2_g1_i1:194-568(-)
MWKLRVIEENNSFSIVFLIRMIPKINGLLPIFKVPLTHLRNRTFGTSCFRSWMVAGDFNEIFDKIKKWGGVKFHPNKAWFCLNFVEEMRMVDLETIGPFYIWNNTRNGMFNFKERFDRAIGNLE